MSLNITNQKRSEDKYMASDVKWIKIVVDIFSDEKILLIESIPEADSIIVIWFKLLCLAGKNNNSGVFTMNDKIPYTEEMLSTIFRRPLNTIRLALQTFESFEMIEIINGTIIIPNWGKHQNLEGIENRKNYMKGYMKEYREKQKMITQIVSPDESSDLSIEWKMLKSIFGDECVYCGRKESDTGTLQKDHIIPFGSDGDFVLGNIVPACKNCNRSKNNKDLNKWYPEQIFFNQTRLNTIIEYQNNTDEFICKGLHKHLRKCNVNSPEVELYSKEVDSKEVDNKEEDSKEIDRKELENIKTKKRKITIPPSIKDVKDYCDERQNGIDPQHFIDYNETRGWFVGKSKMKDWKAAIRTWEKNQKDKSDKSNDWRNF